MASALLFSACNKEENSESKEKTDTLEIVTSIHPLYSLTSHLIEGTNARLANAIAPNASEHSTKLSPEQIKEITEADLLIINGLGLEAFVNDNLVDLEDKIVDTSKGVELIKLDPHIWLSPKNARVQAQNILDALVKKDPNNAKIYNENFERLSLKLDELYLSGKNRLKKLDIKPYLVFHDAYQYFERDFEVHSAAFLEEFAGQEPSVQYLAEVIDIIKNEKVEAAFSEPQFSPKLLQTLSSDYDIKIGVLDPVGQEVSKDGYFNLINDNIAAFEKMFDEK